MDAKRWDARIGFSKCQNGSKRECKILLHARHERKGFFKEVSPGLYVFWIVKSYNYFSHNSLKEKKNVENLVNSEED